MKSVSGREFARIIERRGWILLRISGSHHIYGKSGSIVRLSVPDPWQQTIEDRSAATSGEARRTFRRRSLVRH
jgi:predicted RNA binding protein YcfA (HicA-like mRNA interferase family)